MLRKIKKENIILYSFSIASMGILTYFTYNNVVFVEKYIILSLGAIGIVLSIFKNKMLFLPSIILIFLSLLEKSLILSVASVIVLILVNYVKDRKEENNAWDLLALPLVIVIIIGGGIKNPLIFLVSIVVYIYLYYDSIKYIALPISIVLNLFIDAASYNVNSFFNVAEIKDIKKLSDYLLYSASDYKIMQDILIFTNLIKAQFFIYVVMFISFLVIPYCIEIYNNLLNNINSEDRKTLKILGIPMISCIFLYIAHNLSIILFTVKCFVEGLEKKKNINEILSFINTIKDSILSTIQSEVFIGFRWYILIIVAVIAMIICYIIEKTMTKNIIVDNKTRKIKFPVILYLLMYSLVLFSVYNPSLSANIVSKIDIGIKYLKDLDEYDKNIYKSKSKQNEEPQQEVQYIGNARVEGVIVSDGGVDINNEKYREIIENHRGRTLNNVWSEYYSPTLNETMLIETNKISGSRNIYNIQGENIACASEGLKDEPIEKTIEMMVLSWEIAEAIDRRYGGKSNVEAEDEYDIIEVVTKFGHSFIEKVKKYFTSSIQ